MSRFGGFRKGRKRIFQQWDDLKADNAGSVEAPTTVQELDYTKAKGIWNLRSTMQFPNRGNNVVFDPESGLTLTSSFATGDVGNGSVNTSQNAVFACEITWPATFNTNGILFEMGGTGTGSGVGFINSGATLRVTAGAGGSDPGSPTTTADVDIASTSLTAGESGTLVWEFQINPGQVRVWWNGTLLDTGGTSGGGTITNWGGGNNGHFGGPSGTAIVASLVNAAFPGTISSNLRYYQNQLVA